MDESGYKDVTIHVPQEIIEKIKFLLEPEFGDLDEDEIIEKFALIGFEQFYNWISGNKRYRTLTEQHIAWLENVYTRLISDDEVPSYSRLYNKFNIPYGRAGYMIRVLNERNLPYLRDKAREELLEALEEVRENAQEAIDENRLGQKFAIRITSLASRELRDITNVLYRRDRATILPKSSTSYGDIKTIMVPALTVIEVLDELNQ